SKLRIYRLSARPLALPGVFSSRSWFLCPGPDREDAARTWFTAMSQIEKLEMVGFKSFCDRTQLSFHEGITAVGGPSGCGKSNIADAISWVVGEQSAKSLRTDRMEGIIFNGTQARKATSMAEVMLSLKLLENVRGREGWD